MAVRVLYLLGSRTDASPDRLNGRRDFFRIR
jgi:hypothetical protein